MRPSRIIVGEVREAEALDMLIARNSGLPGLATIHANSARDAVTKLCTLPLLAGENISSRFVVPTVASAADLVVHLDMLPDDGGSVRSPGSPGAWRTMSSRSPTCSPCRGIAWCAGTAIRLTPSGSPGQAMT